MKNQSMNPIIKGLLIFILGCVVLWVGAQILKSFSTPEADQIEETTREIERLNEQNQKNLGQ